MSEPYVKFRQKTNDRLADVEERLGGHDEEIADLDADLLTLVDACARIPMPEATRKVLRKIARRRSE